MPCSSEDNEALFTVSISTSDSKDILIIASATLSFLKTFLAVGTYSNLNVVLAFLELISTGLAFAIFIWVDLVEEAGWPSNYEQDFAFHITYLAAFVTSVVLEITDLCVTFKTVRLYKRIKQNDDVSRELLGAIKQTARGLYVYMLVVSLIGQGIIPIVAFLKANWDPDLFSPTPFEGSTEVLVLLAVCFLMASSMLSSCEIIFNCGFKPKTEEMEEVLNAATDDEDNEAQFAEALKKMFGANITALTKVAAILALASAVLSYIVLSRVTGAQAGGFSFLVLLNVAQFVELSAEHSRHVVWVFFDRLSPFLVLSVDEESATSVSDTDGEPFRGDKMIELPSMRRAHDE